MHSGGPVSEHAADNLELLYEVNFIERRTQQHELQAYYEEIMYQGIVKARENNAPATEETEDGDADRSIDADGAPALIV